MKHPQGLLKVVSLRVIAISSDTETRGGPSVFVLFAVRI